MHADVGHLQRGHRAEHLRVGQPAGDVVDQHGPGFGGGRGHLRLHGVDAHRDPGRAECPHHRQHPPQLLGGAHPLRSRPGRLPAHVDDVGALRGQPQADLPADTGARAGDRRDRSLEQPTSSRSGHLIATALIGHPAAPVIGSAAADIRNS